MQIKRYTKKLKEMQNALTTFTNDCARACCFDELTRDFVTQRNRLRRYQTDRSQLLVICIS